MKTLVASSLALAAFGSVVAADTVTPVDAVWTNTATTSGQWLDVSNWSTPSGGAIERPPTNAADSVVLPAGGTPYGYMRKESITFGKGSTLRWNFGLASLTDESEIIRNQIAIRGQFYASCWEEAAWLTSSIRTPSMAFSGRKSSVSA